MHSSSDREFLDRDARLVRGRGITTFAVGVQGALVPELRVSNSVANWLNEWLPLLKRKAQAHFRTVQINHKCTAWPKSDRLYIFYIVTFD